MGEVAVSDVEASQRDAAGLEVVTEFATRSRQQVTHPCVSRGESYVHAVRALLRLQGERTEPLVRQVH